MAAYDFYGWEYICECGQKAHINPSIEARALDEEKSFEQDVKRGVDNVVRLFPELCGGDP
jgi:hypothetical protein